VKNDPEISNLVEKIECLWHMSCVKVKDLTLKTLVHAYLEKQASKLIESESFLGLPAASDMEPGLGLD
jgi:hypothetical protein